MEMENKIMENLLKSVENNGSDRYRLKILDNTRNRGYNGKKAYVTSPLLFPPTSSVNQPLPGW